MFDSTPHKSPPIQGRNEIMNEVIASRLSALQSERHIYAARPPQPALDRDRILDLICVWNGDLYALKESIDIASNWGPFELAECWPIQYGDDRSRRVLCRFVYHGPLTAGENDPNSRGQFEHCLRAALAKITTWEDVPA